MQVMEFKVVMHCEGCAGGVRKVLKKTPGDSLPSRSLSIYITDIALRSCKWNEIVDVVTMLIFGGIIVSSLSEIHAKCAGVESYTVDYKQQKATVIGTADPEEIMTRIRKSGKTVSLMGRSPAPAPAAVEAPPAEPKAEEKKLKDGKPFFSLPKKMPNLRAKMPSMPAMPAMPALKMPDLQKRMSNLKMQDLQKKMPNICDRMPKNAVTNACREFMSKGVFYAAHHDVSDSELESLNKGT